MARYGYDYGDAPLSFNAALSETLARVRDSWQTVAAYILLLGVGGAASEYFLTQNPAAGSGLRMGIGIATIVGTYLLIEDMLGKCGQLVPGLRRRYLPYLGQSIVAVLGIAAGMALLVVPGIIIALRWVLAPSLLVGRGERAIDALGTSWRLTKGHAMAIFLTGLVVMLPLVLVTILGTVLVEGESVGQAGHIAALAAANLASTAINVFSSALGVAVLRLLDPDTEEMEAVFA